MLRARQIQSRHLISMHVIACGTRPWMPRLVIDGYANVEAHRDIRERLDGKSDRIRPIFRARRKATEPAPKNVTGVSDPGTIAADAADTGLAKCTASKVIGLDPAAFDRRTRTSEPPTDRWKICRIVESRVSSGGMIFDIISGDCWAAAQVSIQAFGDDVCACPAPSPSDNPPIRRKRENRRLNLMAVPILLKPDKAAQACVPPIGTGATSAKTSEKCRSLAYCHKLRDRRYCFISSPRASPIKTPAIIRRIMGTFSSAQIPRTVLDRMRTSCRGLTLCFPPQSTSVRFQLRFPLSGICPPERGYAFVTWVTAVPSFSARSLKRQYCGASPRSNVLLNPFVP